MRQAALTVRSFRFSTDEIPPRSRATAIRELHERGVVPLEPLRDHVAQVNVVKWFLPGAGILCGRLGGVRQVAASHTPDVGDDLFLGLNLAGRSIAVQRSREVALEAGDAVFLSHDAGPFALIRPTPVRFVGLRVPRRALAPLLGERNRPAMQLIARETPALALVGAYVRAITSAPVLASAEAAELAARHLRDLVALCAGATREAAEEARGGVRAARLVAMKSDIAALLADEALTVATLAARHGVTPRYVHKLFESEGVTYTQFVLRQRLERAHRMLRDSEFAQHTIASIAYDVGFGDLSYFNRMFRRRFGATPSDVRNL